MNKIKHILNPGSKKDDEVMYGSGKSDDPVHTGQAGSGNATSSNRTGDDMPGANRADVDNPYYKGNQPSTTGAAGTSGYSTEPSSTSRVPGTFDDDTATTASVKSGVIGESQGGSALAGSGATDSSTNKPLPMEPESATGHSGYGPHDSSLANKADPRVDSDLDGSRGLGSSTTGTGSGLTGTSLPDRSVGSSGYDDNSALGSSNLGRDAALGAGAGVLGAGATSHHHQREGQDIGGDSGRSFPLGGNSATGMTTNEPGLGSTSSGIGSGTGPTASSSHQGSLGRDLPLAGAYNEESWRHDHSAHGHEFGGDPCGGPEAGAPHFTQGPHALDTANRLDPHVSGGPTEHLSTGTSSTTGPALGSSTLGADSTSSTGLRSSTSGDHGRDAAMAGGAGAAGLGVYGSSRDGPSSTTAGPHSSNLLNKGDPRVDSDLSGQRDTTNFGTGSGLPGSTSAATGPHSSTMTNEADPRVDSDLSGSRDRTTVGPASGVVGTSAAGTSLPSDITLSDQTPDRDHHLGRDAGLAGAGAGAAGLGAYETAKHHGTSGTTSSTTPSDPYSTSGADPRIDPTSRSGTSGFDRPTGTDSTSRSGDEPTSRSGTSGLGGSSGSDPTSKSVISDTSHSGTSGLRDLFGPHSTKKSVDTDSTSTGKDHHHGRDTGASSGNDPTSRSGISDTSHSGTSGLRDLLGPHSTKKSENADPTSTDKDHHYGRDAGIVGAGGLAAYQGQKHLGGNASDPSHPTQPSSGALYDSGNGPTTGLSQTGTAPTSQIDTGSTATDPSQTGTGHHYGRDAAVGTGGAGLAGTAYEAQKRHGDPSSTTDTGAYDTREPTSMTGTESYDTRQPTSTTDTGAYDTREPTQSHTGRNAALAGGAGVGAGALAGEALSEKDLKHQQHEMEKEQRAHQKELEKEQKAEQKAHEKEIAHEQKHHQHELEKQHKAEQKAHEKEVAHEQKHHQHEVEKAEKAHQKELEKAEKEQEHHEKKKKHGGLLGLFHRDKKDDEPKHDELQRKDEPDISRDGAAGAMQNPELTHGPGDTTNLSDYEQRKRAGEFEGMSEADKLQHARQHDRNRLHKDPPPGYIEKKMEEQGMSGGPERLPDGRVVDPHTGLPMDLSKDPTGGAGGTDSTPVPGYHTH